MVTLSRRGEGLSGKGARAGVEVRPLFPAEKTSRVGSTFVLCQPLHSAWTPGIALCISASTSALRKPLNVDSYHLTLLDIWGN